MRTYGVKKQQAILLVKLPSSRFVARERPKQIAALLTPAKKAAVRALRVAPKEAVDEVF